MPRNLPPPSCFGDETEGSTVDAVAQSAGPGRTVFKHMAQVGITLAAAHLHAVHAVAAVREFRDGTGHDRLCKAGPSAAGIKFVGRGKRGSPVTISTYRPGS